MSYLNLFYPVLANKLSAMFTKCPSVTQEHIQTTTALAKLYIPIENDPNIPFEEKRKHMVDWWSSSEKSMR